MVLVLVVGDAHIPHRAASLPDVFCKMLTHARIDTVLITGNVACAEMYHYFRTLAMEVVCTRGEYDEQWNSNLPSSTTVSIEQITIGLTHGHQIVPAGNVEALAAMQRKLDVDVLISGATHAHKVMEYGDHLFINPGSVTGVSAASAQDVLLPPSFVLLDIQGKSVSVFSYQYDAIKSEGITDATNGTNASQNHADNSGLHIQKKVWTKTS